MRSIFNLWLVFCWLFFAPGWGTVFEVWAGDEVKPEAGVCFLQAVQPTPVYAIPEIISLYYADTARRKSELRLDKLGHLRELEFIALPGTKFMVVRKLEFDWGTVYAVQTRDYPSRKPLYVAAEFVVPCTSGTPERSPVLPAVPIILQRLRELEGQPYCWGGNYSSGIEKLLELYPPGEKAGDVEFMQKYRGKWVLEGVDCSGMLYEATDGFTPRNTSELVHYGRAVSIAGLTAREIAEKLKSLDLIVWHGHVVVVFDKDTVIESRPRYPDGHRGGVRLEPLLGRLEEVLETRVPVDDYARENTAGKRFVVRRFIAEED